MKMKERLTLSIAILTHKPAQMSLGEYMPLFISEHMHHIHTNNTKNIKNGNNNGNNNVVIRHGEMWKRRAIMYRDAVIRSHILSSIPSSPFMSSLNNTSNNGNGNNNNGHGDKGDINGVVDVNHIPCLLGYLTHSLNSLNSTSDNSGSPSDLDGSDGFNALNEIEAVVWIQRAFMRHIHMRSQRNRSWRGVSVSPRSPRSASNNPSFTTKNIYPIKNDNGTIDDSVNSVNSASSALNGLEIDGIDVIEGSTILQILTFLSSSLVPRYLEWVMGGLSPISSLSSLNNSTSRDGLSSIAGSDSGNGNGNKKKMEWSDMFRGLLMSHISPLHPAVSPSSVSNGSNHEDVKDVEVDIMLCT